MRAGDGASHVLLLDGATRGLLRRYRLGWGKESPLGQQWPLALKGGRKAIWCGLMVGETPALVAADRDRPQMLIYRLGPDGWSSQQTYPTINDVEAIAAPRSPAVPEPRRGLPLGSRLSPYDRVLRPVLRVA